MTPLPAPVRYRPLPPPDIIDLIPVAGVWTLPRQTGAR